MHIKFNVMHLKMLATGQSFALLAYSKLSSQNLRWEYHYVTSIFGKHQLNCIHMHKHSILSIAAAIHMHKHSIYY